MVDTSQAREILIEEMEELLDAAAPQEADSAALYVESFERFQAKPADERTFGIPGGGLAMLVGPILLQFVVLVAKEFLEVARNKGLETIVVSLIDYLKRKFRLESAPRPREVSPELKKQETVTAIVTALIKAGWDAAKAGATAEQVWATGIRTGERLVAEGQGG